MGKVGTVWYVMVHGMVLCGIICYNRNGMVWSSMDIMDLSVL